MKKQKKLKPRGVSFRDICKDEFGNENIFCKVSLQRRII